VRARAVVPVLAVLILFPNPGCSRGPAAPSAGPGATLPSGAYTLRVTTGEVHPSGTLSTILCISMGVAPPGSAAVPVHVAAAPDGWTVTSDDGRLTFLLKREGSHASATVFGSATASDGASVRFGGANGPAALLGRLGTGYVSGPVEGSVSFLSAAGSLSCSTNSFVLSQR
jgi:hypothetical protein